MRIFNFLPSEFVKMQKIRHDGIQAAAGGKSQFQFGVGFTSGEIRIHDIKSVKKLAEFPAGNIEKIR